MDSVDVILNKTLGTFDLALLILGSIGNIICFLICMREKLRKVPTFIFLGFIALVDTISLYGWNFDHFIQAYFKYVFDDVSKTICRTILFYQCFSLQSSSWLLVCMSVERLLSVKFVVWRRSFYTSRKAIITALLVIIIFVLINGHVLFTLDFVVAPNETLTGKCYKSFMWIEWRGIHVYIYSIIPFIILTIVNIILLVEVIRRNNKALATRTKNNKSKQRSMSISVIILTLLFIVLTGPNAIVGIFLSKLLVGIPGLNILFLCNTIGFAYHSSNFLVFFFGNKQFSREIKVLLRCNEKNHQTNFSTTVE